MNHTRYNIPCMPVFAGISMGAILGLLTMLAGILQTSAQQPPVAPYMKVYNSSSSYTSCRMKCLVSYRVMQFDAYGNPAGETCWSEIIVGPDVHPGDTITWDYAYVGLNLIPGHSYDSSHVGQTFVPYGDPIWAPVQILQKEAIPFMEEIIPTQDPNDWLETGYLVIPTIADEGNAPGQEWVKYWLSDCGTWVTSIHHEEWFSPNGMTYTVQCDGVVTYTAGGHVDGNGGPTCPEEDPDGGREDDPGYPGGDPYGGCGC